MKSKYFVFAAVIALGVLFVTVPKAYSHGGGLFGPDGMPGDGIPIPIHEFRPDPGFDLPPCLRDPSECIADRIREEMSADDDGDSVANMADRCPGTVAGTTVDEHGCALDSDGDGIIDDVDDCDLEAAPDTTNGCPVVADTSDDTSTPDDATIIPEDISAKASGGCNSMLVNTGSSSGIVSVLIFALSLLPIVIRRKYDSKYVKKLGGNMKSRFFVIIALLVVGMLFGIKSMALADDCSFLTAPEDMDSEFDHTAYPAGTIIKCCSLKDYNSLCKDVPNLNEPDYIDCSCMETSSCLSDTIFHCADSDSDGILNYGDYCDLSRTPPVTDGCPTIDPSIIDRLNDIPRLDPSLFTDTDDDTPAIDPDLLDRIKGFHGIDPSILAGLADDDGDGVINADDDCAGTETGVAVDENGCAPTPPIFDYHGGSGGEAADNADARAEGCSLVQNGNGSGIISALIFAISLAPLAARRRKISK